MSDEISITDEDTLAFLSECRELIEEVEPYMIEISQQAGPDGHINIETINYIFRLFHTIKGSASFFQFDNIVRVTHEAEAILELLKHNIPRLPESLTDTLCKTCDFINEMLSKIERTGSDDSPESNIEELLGELISCYNDLSEIISDKNDLTHDDLPEEKPTVTSPPLAEENSGQILPDPPATTEITLSDHIKIFIKKTRTLIDSTMRVLTEEKKSEDISPDDVTVDPIYAALKTIKESASFLQLSSISKFSEASVNILSAYRNNPQASTDNLRGLLLKIYNFLNLLVNEIEVTGTDSISKKEIHRIINFLHSDSDHDIKIISELILKAIESLKETCVSSETATCDFEYDIHEEKFSVTPKMLETFIQESGEQFENIEEILVLLDESPENGELLEETLRLLHNFKGNCGVMGYKDLERISHHTETLLEKIKEDCYIMDAWDIRALLLVTDSLTQTIKNLTLESDGSVKNMNTLIDVLNGMVPSGNGKTQEVIERDGIFLLRKGEDTEPPDLFSDTPQSSEKNGRKNNPLLFGKKDSSNQFKKRQTSRQDIRVNLSKLDDLVTLVGELVIAETLVTKNPDLATYEFENFERASNHLSKIVRDIQDITLSIRMIPIHGVFRKMIRLVHDLSSKSEKKVQLLLSGEDTEIDKTVAELIADPLVHIIRNAIDHGIEAPNVRKSLGKPEIANIYLDAKHEGSEIWIKIRDDGQGLDKEKIIAKAIEKNLITDEEKNLTDTEIHSLIFHPGFSTAARITDVSGRGVGMDVVKKNIEKIKGSINIKSSPGNWTEFILRIPLTLAIIEGMLLRVGNTIYTVPMLSIKESIQVNPETITTTMDGQEMVKVRDEIIPVIRLHDVYKIKPDNRSLEEGLLVIVEHQEETISLFIDEIIGDQQTVIKGLSNYIPDIPGISGCTILGNGEVSLILDIGGLIKRVQNIKAA